jgi:hypothetical protein
MSLQDKLDALKKNFESSAPKEALDIMHRATDDLRSSGILQKALDIGDSIPEFTLVDTREQTVSFGGLMGNGPFVLCFYRGKW